MKIYEYPPIFGFEFSSCCYISNQFICDVDKERKKEDTQNRSEDNKFDLNSFVETYKSDEKGEYRIRNITKALEWIPIIGSIIGIARILKAVRTYDGVMLLRGLVATTTLGCFLIPVDVAISLARYLHNYSPLYFSKLEAV